MKPRRPSCPARGFSLIEVLVAVLILGLGMLGLGAILPVIVKAQRDSAELTTGTIAAREASGYLAALGENASKHPGIPGFFEMWADSYYIYDSLPITGGWSPVLPSASNIDTVADVMLWPEAGSRSRYHGQFLPPGTLNTPITIALGDRLWPSDTSGVGQPLMVWDLAVRRVSNAQFNTTSETEQIEAAIFVRRIDPRITLDPGTSLYDALQNTLVKPDSQGRSQRRWPVSVDADGVPRLDGAMSSAGGQYAHLILLPVKPYPADSQLTDTIEFDSSGYTRPGDKDWYPYTSQIAFSLLTQNGQRVVDQRGNVYTVLGADPAAPGTYRFKLDRPMPWPQFSSGTETLLLSPVVPSAVVVTRITP